MTVVRSVTISRTKMTGFLTSMRGSSLRKDAPTAGHTICGSSNADIAMPLRVVELSIAAAPGLVGREQRAGGHRQVFDDGPEREGREEGEPADDHNDADQETDEQSAGGWEGAGRRWHRLLGRQRAGDRHGRDDHPETANQH